MNKNLIFAARTKEALKSYAQLNRLNPNNYVLVPVPDALRQNKIVKSLVQNITNPDVNYVMVHKSCVTVTHNGKPALNITALSENAYASSLNRPEEENIGEKYVGPGGNLKSLVADIYNSNLSDNEKIQAFGYIKSFVAAEKEKTLQNTLKSVVADVESSNLGRNEKVAVLKSLSNYLKPTEVNTITVIKSFLSDINQSNLPLQLKNFLFSVIKSRVSDPKRSEAITGKDEFVRVGSKKNMGATMSDSSMGATPTMTSMKGKDKDKKHDHEDKEVTKSLGSLGSKVFEKRDLVEENRQLLKSLGSLSDDEGLFTNVQMARRYARLFNEKIASPSQRAEVASPSVKDVQRFGKRVKARINMV